MSGTSGEAMAEDWSELDTGGTAALTSRRQGASFPACNTERSASHTHTRAHTHARTHTRVFCLDRDVSVGFCEWQVCE